MTWGDPSGSKGGRAQHFQTNKRQVCAPSDPCSALCAAAPRPHGIHSYELGVVAPGSVRGAALRGRTAPASPHKLKRFSNGSGNFLHGPARRPAPRSAAAASRRGMSPIPPPGGPGTHRGRPHANAPRTNPSSRLLAAPVLCAWPTRGAPLQHARVAPPGAPTLAARACWRVRLSRGAAHEQSIARATPSVGL